MKNKKTKSSGGRSKGGKDQKDQKPKTPSLFMKG